MENRDLKKFYNSVYKKGERLHYTKLLFAKGRLAEDRAAVLEEMTWKGKRVLDVGCGTGETAYLIAGRGAEEVIGLDYSEDAIAIAKKTHSHPRLFFMCDDSARMRGLFDVIISMGTLEHMDNPLDALRKYKRMLARGGSLIITSPNWSNPRGYVLLALKFLFNAPVTRADIHYFTPRDFQAFASRLGMALSWKTVDHEWSQGRRLLFDLKKRLPNVFKDMKMPIPEKNIAAYITWLQKRALEFEKPEKHTGAIGVYHFKLN